MPRKSTSRRSRQLRRCPRLSGSAPGTPARTARRAARTAAGRALAGALRARRGARASWSPLPLQPAEGAALVSPNLEAGSKVRLSSRCARALHDRRARECRRRTDLDSALLRAGRAAAPDRTERRELPPLHRRGSPAAPIRSSGPGNGVHTRGHHAPASPIVLPPGSAAHRRSPRPGRGAHEGAAPRAPGAAAVARAVPRARSDWTLRRRGRAERPRKALVGAVRRSPLDLALGCNP